MEKNLFDALKSVRSLPLDLQTHIGEILKHKVLRKKDFLLKAGQINDKICFIQRGLLRAYYLRDEVEISSWFMTEGDFTVSITSFYEQVESYEYIQAIEDTEVLYITYKELDDIYERFLEFDYVGLKLTLKYFVQWDRQLYAIRMTSAEERYQWLLKNKPDLLSRVPAKYIASYLGITAETFSKIRSAKLVGEAWPIEKKAS